MKNRIVIIMLVIAMSLSMMACGSKKENENKNVESTTNETVEKEEETPKKDVGKSEALAGVYPAADELVEIPLGIYYKGAQTDFCKIQAPLNYWSGAIYYDEQMEDHGSELSDGAVLLSNALDAGLLEADYSIQNFMLSNPHLAEIPTNIMCTIGTTEQHGYGYDEIKEAYENGIELKNKDNRAFYYVDEYTDTDLVLIYEINSEAMLQVQYTGPLAEELGLDQIAENLYNIVEVIE